MDLKINKPEACDAPGSLPIFPNQFEKVNHSNSCENNASRQSKIAELLELSLLSKRTIKPQPVNESIKQIVRSKIYDKFLMNLHLSQKQQGRLHGIGLTDEQIEFLRIRDCPSLIVNLEACSAVNREYGDISDCAGFFRTEHANFKFDIDERFANVGLLCAERNSHGLIVGIRVFRHLLDEKSFRIRTRERLVRL